MNVTIPQPKNPLFRERILEQLTRQEFMKHIHCRLDRIEAGSVSALIDLGVEHKQQSGLTHGGVIATLADVAAGFAGFTLIAVDQQMVTVELKVSYYYPARGSRLRAEGRVMKHGNTLSYCEADVYSVSEDGQELLCARATATMAIIKEQLHS